MVELILKFSVAISLVMWSLSLTLPYCGLSPLTATSELLIPPDDFILLLDSPNARVLCATSTHPHGSEVQDELNSRVSSPPQGA